jgi:GTP cyclohydrolase FolE2
MTIEEKVDDLVKTQSRLISIIEKLEDYNYKRLNTLLSAIEEVDRKVSELSGDTSNNFKTVHDALKKIDDATGYRSMFNNTKSIEDIVRGKA